MVCASVLLWFVPGFSYTYALKPHLMWPCDGDIENKARVHSVKYRRLETERRNTFGNTLGAIC